MRGKGLRQSMAWIHGWLGLVAGWILFAMFLTGTASYFRPEVTRWMQPEFRPRPVAQSEAARGAIAWLQRNAPHDEQWTIYLPTERTLVTRVFTRARPNPDPKAPSAPRRPEIRLDPANGLPVEARETRGGEFFYRFHFQLQLPHPWGRWLAGLCAMFMLGAILSGVITHKRIFVDFFTLRWSKGQRSWLDAHNVSAVLALPYHAMITYTGLITLVVMYMPWPIAANYPQPAAFSASLYGDTANQRASGRPGQLADIARFVEAASAEWRGARVSRIIVGNPDDASSTVTLLRSSDDRLNARGASITYAGGSGQRLAASPAPGPAVETAGVMLGLHLAWFAGPLLRWVCFLLGLTGGAMVATGLVLWTVKRRRPGAKPVFGLSLVERLNIGVIACLPAGMAAYLLANRLLPPMLPGRADLEVSAMFWTWFGLAGLSLLRPACRAWIETLAIAALVFAAIPIADLAAMRGIPSAPQPFDGLFLAFDATMALLAAALGFAAWRLAKRPIAAARPSRRTVPARPEVARPEVREAADVA